MTHYSRPDELVFASGAKPGEVQGFPDIPRGWGVAYDQTAGIPPMEWFNALFKRGDEGLRYLLQSLRVDLASEGIDVTVVSPGFVDTPLTQRNDFPMPMRWPVERAARYIAERLERRPLDIAFPRPFILTLGLLGSLPARLRLAIGKRLSRNGAPS